MIRIIKEFINGLHLLMIAVLLLLFGAGFLIGSVTGKQHAKKYQKELIECQRSKVRYERRLEIIREEQIRKGHENNTRNN